MEALRRRKGACVTSRSLRAHVCARRKHMRRTRVPDARVVASAQHWHDRPQF